MTIVEASRLAGLLCVVATAFLLNACQQNPSPGPNGTYATQQGASDDQAGWQKRHCCRRASRNR